MSDATTHASAARPPAIEVVRRRHPGQWVAGGVILAVAAVLAITVASNETIRFDLIPGFLIHPLILTGVATTLELTLLGMTFGAILGVLAAIMRLSDNPVVSSVGRGYVWFFRGTPVLVQLVFWFNIAVLFPTISLGPLVSWPTNDLVGPFVAAWVGLALHSGAYISEIVRAGILAVPTGQVDAAKALGMAPRLVMRRVVLPQAVPIAVPPLGNEFVAMLKYSSLASVVAVKELLGSAQALYATNLRTMELLIVASLWYLTITTLFGFGQRRLEDHVGRGRGAGLGRSA